MSETEIAIFKLGEAAKAMINSDLGKYLNGVSSQDIQSAKDLLFDLDPYGYQDLKALQDKIASIQFKGKVAEAFINYISETIERGRQSEHQLETED